MLISMIPTDDRPVIYCSQYDTSLREWTFTLHSNYVVYSPTESAYLICENGETVTLTIDGSDLICDCTSELSATVGRFECKIKLIESGETIYSSLFYLCVEGL